MRRIKEAFKKSTGENGNALSKKAFIQEVLCEPVPKHVEVHVERLFQAFSGSNKGINFKDLTSALVLITKGLPEEKIK